VDDDELGRWAGVITTYVKDLLGSQYDTSAVVAEVRFARPCRRLSPQLFSAYVNIKINVNIYLTTSTIPGSERFAQAAVLGLPGQVPESPQRFLLLLLSFFSILTLTVIIGSPCVMKVMVVMTM
jgi:hypothetical protein